MSEDAPVCRNCQHLAHKRKAGLICKRVLLTRHDPVNGRVAVRANAPAHRERASERTLFGRTRCGPQARFFDPIPRLEEPQP
jgi:hypothetical protein